MAPAAAISRLKVIFTGVFLAGVLFFVSAPLCLIPVHWGNGIIDHDVSDKPCGGCVIATVRKGAYLGADNANRDTR